MCASYCARYNKEHGETPPSSEYEASDQNTTQAMVSAFM